MSHDLGQAQKAWMTSIATCNAYTQCLTIQPNDSEVWYSLGTIYAGRRQLPEAKNCFGQALQIKPDFASAREALQQLDAK